MGFLFYFSLLNVCKIKLLELVFGFCGGCVRLGVQIYINIRINHWKYVSKYCFFIKPTKLGKYKLVTPSFI